MRGTQPPRAPGSALLLLGLALSARPSPTVLGTPTPVATGAAKSASQVSGLDMEGGEGCLQDLGTRRQGRRTRIVAAGPRWGHAAGVMRQVELG